MINRIVAGTTHAGALALAVALVQPLAVATAQDSDPQPTVHEMILGSPEAPVTLTEYVSFTCPHCATFHEEVFPDLKRDYIDTGKVAFVMREVYFDKYGLWAGMLARCGGPERYFGIVDLLFARQDDWSRQEDPVRAVRELFRIGRIAGLDDEAMQQCVKDEEKTLAMVEVFRKNTGEDNVRSTPSIVLDGDNHGNPSYAELKAILDAALGG